LVASVVLPTPPLGLAIRKDSIDLSRISRNQKILDAKTQRRKELQERENCFSLRLCAFASKAFEFFS
jgi:hypothetical protein